MNQELEMVDKPQKRPRKAIVLLLVMVAIMIGQNFLLVKKVDEKEENIERLQVLFDPRITSKKTLLLVFTTWCKACEANMDRWNQLVQDIQDRDILILGLTSDSLYKVKAYKERVPFSFSAVSLAHDFSIMKKYKLLSYPKTIVLGTTGVVLQVWNGVLDEGEVKDIKHYLRDQIS